MKPYYQSGVSGVEHRNIDASGSDHPFGDEPKEWEADIRPFIRQVADDMYDSWHATVREYLANAETACLKVEQYLDDPEDSPYDDVIVDESYEPRIEVTWDKSKQKLTISDNGIGMAAVEVDQVFRHIGRSAARDLGAMSGAFGMGALSFPKFIGTGNSTMIMLSNSRLNEDNAAYLVSLAGIEPIRGSLEDDEYGTTFKLDQKERDMDIRDAVTTYAEWMRVPVIYREIDENGSEQMNEDYGGKQLFDEYDDDQYCVPFVKDGMFEAYMSPDATGRTLLLSMDIDRNRGGSSGAPHDYDIRLLDESGRVIESESGNEGRIPVPRPEYEEMLLEARQDHITESLVSSNDVIAHEYEGDEYDYVVESGVLDGETPLPMGAYTTLEEVDESSVGQKIVIAGPNSVRTVVDQETWDELPEGRAQEFVPEDELDEDDICLPQPTTDRSSLQSNDQFWEYVEQYFLDQFNGRIESYREKLNDADDVMQTIQDMEPQTVSKVREQ